MGQQIYVSLKYKDDPEARFYLEKLLAKKLVKITKEKSQESAVGKSEITFGRSVIPFFYDFNKLEGAIEYDDTTYKFKIIIP